MFPAKFTYMESNFVRCTCTFFFFNFQDNFTILQSRIFFWMVPNAESGQNLRNKHLDISSWNIHRYPLHWSILHYTRIQSRISLIIHVCAISSMEICSQQRSRLRCRLKCRNPSHGSLAVHNITITTDFYWVHSQVINLNVFSKDKSRHTEIEIFQYKLQKGELTILSLLFLRCDIQQIHFNLMEPAHVGGKTLKI